MSDRTGAVVGVLAAILIVSFCAFCVEVGERAPSPSHGVAIDTPRPGSEAAPARSRPSSEGTTVPDGNGEDVVPVEEAELAARDSTTPQLEPASTVTQSALKEEGGTSTQWDINPLTGMPTRPTVTVSPTDGGAYIAPVTPVATSRAVETLAPKSINSYDPWPAYLWPVVECLIQRESKGDPYAVGLAGERGLLQVHPITWGYLARYGITPDALFDPATNIRAAYLLYLEAGGLRPWNGGCA